MADMEFGEFETEAAPQGVGDTFQGMVNWAGALTSVALVVGLGVWAYQLTMRDVTGVPVVRALEGPMRVAPENPGGRPAEHQGLAVNSVAAKGEAEDPADRLVLAPGPQPLQVEDRPGAALAPLARPSETPVLAAATPAEDPEPIIAPDPVAAALVLDEAAAPVATPEAKAEPQETIVAAVAPATPEVPAMLDAVPASVPGVNRSPRPDPRPATIRRISVPTSALQAAVAEANAPVELEVSAASVPAGTNLVQLGAYDTAEIARSEWQRLSGRFGSLLEGKQRVVQSAQSGGRTFYRLRAVGFVDIADARRFCAALTAERADCIPVVAR